jgi:hypothetical protein
MTVSQAAYNLSVGSTAATCGAHAEVVAACTRRSQLLLMLTAAVAWVPLMSQVQQWMTPAAARLTPPHQLYVHALTPHKCIVHTLVYAALVHLGRRLLVQAAMLPGKGCALVRAHSTHALLLQSSSQQRQRYNVTTVGAAPTHIGGSRRATSLCQQHGRTHARTHTCTHTHTSWLPLERAILSGSCPKKKPCASSAAAVLVCPADAQSIPDLPRPASCRLWLVTSCW